MSFINLNITFRLQFRNLHFHTRARVYIINIYIINYKNTFIVVVTRVLQMGHLSTEYAHCKQAAK